MTSIRTSEQINELAQALAKAQAEITVVRKDKKANAGKYGYTYASLAAVMTSTAGPLSSNGLSVMQGLAQDETMVVVTTRLLHCSGQWIESDCKMPISSKGPQAVGSAITYGRRYGISTLLGVVTEDDDGAAAQRSAERSESKPKNLASVVDAVAEEQPPAPATIAQEFVRMLQTCNSMAELDELVRKIPKDDMTDAEVKNARIEYAKAKARVAEMIMASE